MYRNKCLLLGELGKNPRLCPENRSAIMTSLRITQILVDNMVGVPLARLSFDELLFLQNIPLQSNKHDCGLFLMKYAECLTRQAPFNFTEVTSYFSVLYTRNHIKT